MAYSFYRTITIDHTKCGASDSADFTVLVSGTYTFLKTVANGGSVQNSSGYDIAFTLDVSGSVFLHWETEAYDPTTGTVIYWVRVPTLSHTADTVIYMFYGNPAVTFDQSSTQAAWNSRFAAVWHWGTSSVMAAIDSTANANNGNIAAVTAVAGQIGGAGSYSGTAAVGPGNGPKLQMSNTSDWTMKAWVNPSSNPAHADIMRYDLGTGTAPLYVLRTDIGSVEFTFGARTAALGTLTTTATIPTGSWTHIVATRTHGSNISIYINGSLAATGSDGSTGTWICNNSVLLIGQYSGGGEEWLGYIDDCYIMNAVASADWVTAEYNNQFSPSTFYSVGSQQTAGGGGGGGGAVNYGFVS